MARYIDADKIHKFVDAKVAEGKDGWAKGVPYEWAYALTVIDNAPTADVAPRAEVARLIDDFQRSIRADAKVGMSAGEILLHINNMLAELKKKYTEAHDETRMD